MKLFAKLMLAMLVLALLLPFTILKDRDGDTLMSFSNFKLPDFSLPKVPRTPNLAPVSEGLDGKDIFYQWYDADGNLQFTTEPPPEGIDYKVKGFDPNTNVIQAVELPEKEDADDEAGPIGKKPGGPEDIGNPYSGDSVKKLFEDTKNIEKMLNQRLKQQEAILNQ